MLRRFVPTLATFPGLKRNAADFVSFLNHTFGLPEWIKRCNGILPGRTRDPPPYQLVLSTVESGVVQPQPCLQGRRRCFAPTFTRRRK